MRQITCERCGGTAPAGKSFDALGKVTCPACLEGLVAQGAKFQTAEALRPLSDPTVCARCRFDNGAADLPTLAGQPMCEACTAHLRNRPFPLWVKIGFAALVVLAVVVLAVNARFLIAHVEANRAVRAFEAGDIERASALMDAAALHVPEVRELQDEALLLRGIRLYHEDKCAEAVEALTACRDRQGPSPLLDQCLLMARRDAAFDAKDYDTFLETSRALMGKQPKETWTVAQMASALACKYAVTGEERYRKEAEEMLARATRLAPAQDAKLDRYVRRVRHRIETREIISSEEYDRRFPESEEGGAK